MTRIAVMGVGAALLYALSAAMLAAPCVSLPLTVAVVAWPIWRYQNEYALFARRAVLARVTHEGSRVRRWFWAGRVSSVGHVFAAIAWAVALLVLANLLDPWHWIVLGADALFLGYLAGPVARGLASDVPPEQLGLVARRWPLPAINFAVLAVAFFAVEFFTGVADTRGIPWHGVAEQAFANVSAGAACPAVGMLVGTVAALQALTWHALQILIPSLPRQEWKLVAWALVLLQAGLVAYAATRLYLGLAAALDRTQRESSRDFSITALVLGVLYLLALFALRDLDGAWLAARGREAVAWADPCRTDSRTVEALRSSLKGRLQKARVEEQQRASARIDDTVNVLYVDVENGVDQYLDWYFTVIGEYQRLAALATGRFEEQMKSELEKRIFGDAFGERLDQASRELAAQSHARIVALGSAMGAEVKSEGQARPCWAGRFDVAALGSLDRDALRVATAAGGGGAAGLITARFLARRAAASAAATASSKRAFRTGASLAGKSAVKRTGSALVAAIGGAAACGPFAPLCALAAAGVTWIALDKAFIEIDELAFRDEMRAEILAAVAEQKAALSEALALQHHADIDHAVSAIAVSVERVFIPARDGT